MAPSNVETNETKECATRSQAGINRHMLHCDLDLRAILSQILCITILPFLAGAFLRHAFGHSLLHQHHAATELLSRSTHFPKSVVPDSLSLCNSID